MESPRESESPRVPSVTYVPKPIQSDPGSPPAQGLVEPIQVCLAATEKGYFELSWASIAPDEYDWVGLYASPQAGDADFIGGAWQWAKSASSYVTSQDARPNAQARYLRWDSTDKIYRALLRTPPFPDRVKSNTYDMTRWMAALVNKDASLADVTLPGTHDSAAWGMYLPATNTQSVSIDDQLKGGIRFLDIRLALSGGALWLYHGSVYLRLSFDDVLQTIYAFLDTHPTEVVVMSIKNEGDAADEFATVLKSRYVDPNSSRFWVSDLVPTVKEAAGKIVVLRRFGRPAVGFDKGFGLDFDKGWVDNGKNFPIQYRSRVDPKRSVMGHVQDFYNTSDVTAKTQAVTDMLTQSEKGRSPDIYLNFASAAGDPYRPYGPNNPYGLAVAVNPPLYTAVVNASPRRRLGWIPMDYPNDTLWLTYGLAMSNDLAAPQ